MKDVTSRLVKNPSKVDELEVVLGQRSSSWDPSEPRRVLIDDGRIVVEYTSRHLIRSVLVADDYDESMIARLESQVEEALSENGAEVQRRYLHTIRPVNGCFRYGDVFQILPSPPDAPQPHFQLGHHSFLLEYKVPKSPNNLVNQHRSTRRFSELSLLLNALLVGLQLPNATCSHEWVVASGTSKYMQLGYFGGKEYRPKSEDGFSETDDLPEFDVVDANHYYSRLGVGLGETLTLPDTFGNSLSAYGCLNTNQKAQFCRASFWSHIASRVFVTSQSAAFAALVSAIEVFLPDPAERCEACGRPTSPDICPNCHQPSAGPTRLFREFVDRYAPGIPSADRSKLYTRRSSLSHGSSLMPGDLSEMGFRFNTDQNTARTEFDLLWHIVQVVLVNWLQAPT